MRFFLDEDEGSFAGASIIERDRLLDKTPHPLSVAVNVGQRSPAGDPAVHAVAGTPPAQVAPGGSMLTPNTHGSI